MIELRWIVRRDDGLPERTNATKKVLQFRTWLVRIDAGGAITPLPLPIDWSDWQDVPTVRGP